MIRILLVISLFLLSLYSSGQILPVEGSVLNYRLVGLSFPVEKGAVKYKIEIAKGKYKNLRSFNKNIIITLDGNTNRIMTEVPAFGEDYTWRVIYSGKMKKDSTLHHFATLANDRVDTAKYRVRLLKHSDDYKDLCFSIDGGAIICDMNCKALAYIPEVNGLTGFVADMDFTRQGTITFGFGRTAYEINLNGDILWKAPDYNVVNGGKEPDYYHHSFIKLSNGHYMTLGMEFIPSRLVSAKDTSYVELADGKTSTDGFSRGMYGTIIEFDKDGKVVWSWKDTKSMVGTDFAYYAATRSDSDFKFDPHCNSLFFDEKNGFVYMSYRNLNRIIKIDYRTQETVEVYGEIFKPGMPSKGRDFFCNPHGVRRSENGYIYFFNNNSCRKTDSLPTIVILKEPVNKDDSLTKIWEYTCAVEGNYSKRFGSGGSVIELPDSSMYVCMGNEYTKLFIVTRGKKVTWSALPERHIETDNVWVPVKQYRTNILKRKDLERMIWDAEIAIRNK